MRPRLSENEQTKSFGEGGNIYIYFLRLYKKCFSTRIKVSEIRWFSEVGRELEILGFQTMIYDEILHNNKSQTFCCCFGMGND